MGRGGAASAGTMEALRQPFGAAQLMEILVTGAYYCAVAQVVTSLDLDLEPGYEHLRARND